MKILLLSPSGKKIDHLKLFNKYENVEYDMESISLSIKEGVEKNIPDAKVTVLSNICPANEPVHEDVFAGFDILLCDLTTCNPNIAYLAGKAENTGKPIIYFHSSDSSTMTEFRDKKPLLYSFASLKDEFQKELSSIVIEANKNPSNFAQAIPENTKSPMAFISYSHQDRLYLDRLLVHLQPLTRNGSLDVWADTKIKTGDRWREEITKALSSSRIAVLLISADFMASDFIINNELQPLLAAAEVKGTKILPVIVSPCRFSREPSLSRFQAANPPSEPLSSMSQDRREVIYDGLAKDIEDGLKSA